MQIPPNSSLDVTRGRPLLTIFCAFIASKRAEQLKRFALVGGAAAIGYFLLAFALERAGLSAVLASTLSFASMMPCSYLGHRRHTFRSNGRSTLEFPKFVVVSLAGLASGAFLPYVICDLIGFPGWIAFLTVCGTTPLISFFAFRYWVFTQREKSLSGH